MEGGSTHYNDLPSGFRFAPTDDELLSYFLLNRVALRQLAPNPIVESDRTALYSTHPKDLASGLAEKASYLFVSGVDERLRNETIRAVGEVGQWRISEPRTEMFNKSDPRLVTGSKIGFTFFNKKGRASPKKTHWRMTEFQLPLQTYHQHNEWVVVAKMSRGTDYGDD